MPFDTRLLHGSSMPLQLGSEEHALDTRLATCPTFGLNTHTRNVVGARWLINAVVARDFGATNLAISNKWDSSTAICCLWSHSVDANNHSDDAAVEKEESKNTDGDHDVQHDWMCRLPFDVTIIIDLRRFAGGTRSDQNHYKLNEQ